jgi:hypothetical protein
MFFHSNLGARKEPRATWRPRAELSVTGVSPLYMCQVNYKVEIVS